MIDYFLVDTVEKEQENSTFPLSDFLVAPGENK
jgi:hypothetical protein